MKKILVTLLAVAMVASLCGMMFVSAEDTNLAAGKSYTTTAIYETDGVQNWPDENGITLTDGVKAASDASYEDPSWVGFNKQSADYDGSEGGFGAVTIIDLGAVADLSKLSFQAFGGAAGISVPYWLNLYTSVDGQEYTQAGYLQIDTDAAVAGVNAYEMSFEATAQYVKICLYGYGWIFIDEFEVFGTAASSEPEDPSEPEQPEDPSEPEQPSEPEVDEKALYEEEYAGLVGEALENPSYNLALDSTTDENGVVTVTVTVTDIAEGVELTGLYAYLYYDMDRMTLTTKVNTDNSLDCLTTVPSESWREDNLTVIDKDEGFINIGAGVADGDIVAISEDKPLVLTFTFQLKEGYEYAGIYMPTENVSGTDFDFADYYGNGAYEIAELPVVDDEPSDEPSKPVTPGGDAGVIVFAVLGLIAICGAAVVVKVRH